MKWLASLLLALSFVDPACAQLSFLGSDGVFHPFADSSVIANSPWTTPPNTESGNSGVPKQSGSPTWAGTGSISGNVFTVVTTTSGSLTAGMTLVGNKILPGTVLVSGRSVTWLISA